MLRSLALVACVAATATAGDAPSPAAVTPTKPDDPHSTSNAERGTTSAAISVAARDEEGTPKLSLPTEADRVAWNKPGFRLGLGVAYGQLHGIHGAPSGRLLAAQLHAGLRLDADWSIMTSFQYALASKTGGLSGLRFAGTVDPTWHVTPSFALAIGFGFGGIVEGRTNRADMTPGNLSTDVSYTYPSPSPPITSCSGVGAAALARGEWMYVLGPRAASVVAFEVIGQYTSCVQKIGLEPDTARPIVRTQYWPHAGATLSWGVTWR